MNRFFQIAVCGLTVVILGGCSGSKQNQDEPIWKHVKLRDLATPDVNGQTDSQLKTINFNVFIYEMPAAKIGDLNDIWQVLYTRQLQFSNYDAFRANSFKVGFGQEGQNWGKIGEVLRKAGKPMHVADLLKEMGKEGLTAINKLTISKDKLPQEIQVVVLE